MPIERFLKLIHHPLPRVGLLRPSLISKRVQFPELMNIDFKIQDITLKDLQSVGYHTSATSLRIIKSKASKIIKEFMFSNPYSRPYVSKEDIEISLLEGIDYISHKYDLIRSIGYALYKIQFRDKFIATETPIINFQKILDYYLKNPNALTKKNVLEYLELFSNPENFNQNDKSIRDLKKKLELYLDTFAKISPSLAGIYTHPPEELAVLESFILDKKLDVQHEKEVDEFGHRPDLTLHIDKNFKDQFAATIKKKYGIDFTKIKTLNFDFSNAYNKRQLTYVSAKFYKNYQSKEAVSFIILTNHKLNDKSRAQDFIAKFDPILAKMGSDLYPENIIIITMDEFISVFGIEGVPLQNLQVIQKIKDQALSHNPSISNEAFETLIQLYTKAKLTLELIKTDPANIVRILQTKQLDLTKFLGDPNKKIDDFL